MSEGSHPVNCLVLMTLDMNKRNFSQNWTESWPEKGLSASGILSPKLKGNLRQTQVADAARGIFVWLLYDVCLNLIFFTLLTFQKLLRRGAIREGEQGWLQKGVDGRGQVSMDLVTHKATWLHDFLSSFQLLFLSWAPHRASAGGHKLLKAAGVTASGLQWGC